MVILSLLDNRTYILFCQEEKITFFEVPNGLRPGLQAPAGRLRWGGNGEAVQPEK
jgi:hypothetical protein